MRSYGQYCSIAKALDVVGDRWTLLIVRELLIRGACRYTDLKDGLPGIATNLLADRLRELESAGLIRREEAPPPVATALFHLTDSGASLLPVIEAIARWGIEFMVTPVEGDQFRGHWFAFPARCSCRTASPTGRRSRSSCAPTAAPPSSRCPAARSAPGSARPRHRIWC